MVLLQGLGQIGNNIVAYANLLGIIILFVQFFRMNRRDGVKDVENQINKRVSPIEKELERKADRELVDEKFNVTDSKNEEIHASLEHIKDAVELKQQHYDELNHLKDQHNNGRLNDIFKEIKDNKTISNETLELSKKLQRDMVRVKKDVSSNSQRILLIEKKID